MKIYWDGKSKNICGKNIRQLRKSLGLSQKQLASKLQLLGYEMSDLTILRIEKGDRFVADYELKAFAEFFKVDINLLFEK